VSDTVTVSDSQGRILDRPIVPTTSTESVLVSDVSESLTDSIIGHLLSHSLHVTCKL